MSNYKLQINYFLMPNYYTEELLVIIQIMKNMNFRNSNKSIYIYTYNGIYI